MNAPGNAAELEERTPIGISGGSLLRLVDARGMQVQVERGVLWITQEGDAKDVLVRGGESFRLDRDGVALLSACGATALTLVSFGR